MGWCALIGYPDNARGIVGPKLQPNSTAHNRTITQH